MKHHAARRSRARVGLRRRAPQPLAMGLLGLVLLGACEAIPRTTVEGEDESVLFPTGRISWDVSPEADAEPAGRGEGARARTRTSIELDLAYGSGEFEQDVKLGQVLQVGSVPFPGPGPVEVFSDLWTADLAGRLEKRWPSGLGLGGRLGLRLSDLDISLRSGSLYLDTTSGADLTSLGLLFGAEGFYEPTGWLRLYVAGSASLGLELSGPASGYEDITTSTLDLGTAWSLGESVRLLGGWRRVGYEADSVDDFLSDIELTLSGPFLGLWVRL